MMYKADHPKSAAECAHYSSYKCLCESFELSNLSNCQCPQLQGGVTVDKLLHPSAAFQGIRHVQRTGETDLRSLSVCISCEFCCCLKLENLAHSSACRQCVTDSRVDHHNSHVYICTCNHNVGKLSSFHCCSAASNIATTVCPAGCKFLQMKRPENPDIRMTSGHSYLGCIQEGHEKTVGDLRPGQLGRVIMDVTDWQRWHTEQLHRQKLEVCHRFFETV